MSNESHIGIDDQVQTFICDIEDEIDTLFMNMAFNDYSLPKFEYESFTRCCAINRKGEQCSNKARHQFDGKHFCGLHIKQ